MVCFKIAFTIIIFCVKLVLFSFEIIEQFNGLVHLCVCHSLFIQICANAYVQGGPKVTHFLKQSLFPRAPKVVIDAITTREGTCRGFINRIKHHSICLPLVDKMHKSLSNKLSPILDKSSRLMRKISSSMARFRSASVCGW